MRNRVGPKTSSRARQRRSAAPAVFARVKTIVVAGYGETAYMNGGGNISASVEAPQKWISVPEYEKTIDLEHGRMRVRQRNHQNFVFAGARRAIWAAPNAASAYLDGDVAYNAAPNGRMVRANDQAARARRLDMMNNPVALVRAALDRPAAVSNPRASRRGSSPTSRSRPARR